MPITLADLHFAETLPAMSDEDFLLTWHAEIVADDEHRIMLVESAATRRLGLSTWHHRYANRFPKQTRYRLPPKARQGTAGTSPERLKRRRPPLRVGGAYYHCSACSRASRRLF